MGKLKEHRWGVVDPHQLAVYEWLTLGHHQFAYMV